MARDGNAPVRGYFVNAASAADISVLHIGAVDQLPPGLLGRVNVSDNLRSVWQSSPSPNWSYSAGSRSETAARPSTKTPTAMSIGRAAAETA
jgi:hypothetical protein